MVLYSFSTRPNLSIIRKPERQINNTIKVIILCQYCLQTVTRSDHLVNQVFSPPSSAYLLLCFHSSKQTDKLKERRARQFSLDIVGFQKPFHLSFFQTNGIVWVLFSFFSSKISENFSLLLPCTVLNTLRCYSLAVAASQTKVMSCSSIFFTASKSSTKKTCLSLGLLAIFTSSPQSASAKPMANMMQPESESEKRIQVLKNG